MVRSLLLILLSLTCYADPQSLAQEIYLETFSPYCPGRSLRDCPSAAADKLKLDILDKANQGKSKKEILDDLEKTFGKKIRSSPNDVNTQILLWIFPLVFLFGGFLFLFKFFIRKK